MSKIESSAVWRQSMDLAKAVYGVTKTFPSEEKFGLVAQLRRAAVSVPANIAEGYGRRTSREFAQFLGIAKGSLLELRTLLILSSELGYVGEVDRLLDHSTECSRLIQASMRSLAAKQ